MEGIRQLRQLVASWHAQCKEGVFVAEGEKAIETLLANGMKPERLVCLQEEWALGLGLAAGNFEVASEAEMARITAMRSPSRALAIFRTPTAELLPFKGGLTLLLDGVQDPGNVGSIVRTGGWFGVKQVVCSPDCARVYSPKGIQASMGALGRVPVVYHELASLLQRASRDEGLTASIYACAAGGVDIRGVHFQDTAVLLLGNEGHGLNPQLLSLAGVKVGIPRAGKGAEGVGYDSLNVGAAAAVLCAYAAFSLFGVAG